MRRFSTQIIVLATFLVLALAIAFFWYSRLPESKGAATLNLLAWTGYNEPSMLEPFEKKFNVKVNYKTFVGGDQMFAILTQSHNTYDVVVVDPEYISKLVSAGRLAPLNPVDYNFSDYLEPFKHFPLAWINGTLYAVIVRFGSNGILYNTDHLTADEANSYSILWGPTLKGRVGIWDWYLPSMGVLSLAMRNSNPYAISDEHFAKLKE
jgi:spermidine/putrescine transport system substrate-binding protein